MDVLIILIGIASIIISFGAQAYIKSAYSKYSKVKTDGNLTGKDVARKILDKNGLSNVKVEEVRGYLSDHYDPKTKMVRLSSDNYNGANVANVAVAAHECGHAIQDGENYSFLRVRASLVPVVNFSSYAGYAIILLGSFTGAFGLIWLGILLIGMILVFQLVTLPVEFNASDRALKQIKEMNLLTDKELDQGREVLTAAALTYVASVVTAIVQVLRLVLIYGVRNRDRR